jgi:hypothetical protein
MAEKRQPSDEAARPAALPVTGSLTCSASIRWEIQAPLALVSPVFGNLFGGLVQPVLVSREPNHFNGCKPFRRIRGGIAQRRQLAHGHQNLNVTLRETKQFRRRHDIKTCRQTPYRPFIAR